MSKIIWIILFLFCYALPSMAQSDSTWRMNLRADALVAFEKHSHQLKSYYEAADVATLAAGKSSRKQLDSLLTDSVFAQAGLELPLLAERLLDYRKVGNTPAVEFTLIAIATELDSLVKLNVFESALLRFARSVAEEIKSDKAAYLCARASLRHQQVLHAFSMDSVQTVAAVMERDWSAEKSAAMNSLRLAHNEVLQWRIFAITMGSLVIIIAVIFIFVRYGLVKRLRAEVNKNLDKSELSVLVKKNEDLRSESEQYKQTLEDVIRKMNQIDQTVRGYAGIMEELKGMTLESLEFIKQQLEESKSKLSPDIYMSLTNSITRCVNSLRQEYDNTIDQLK